MSSVLLCLLVLSAAADPDVRAAEQSYEEAHYREVFPALTRALARPLSDPDRLRAYELLALVNAAFDDEPAAVEAFRRVLGMNAEYRLEPGGSPKLTAIFQRAREQGALKQPLTPERIVEVQLPPPPPPPELPIYRRWYFWAGAVAVVAAGTAGTIYATSSRVPVGSLGTGAMH